jgi:hypothetical protein
MTVAKTHNRKNYMGSGGNKIFAFDFKIFDETDLLVYVAGALAGPAYYPYTISGGPTWTETGGNVIFATAPDGLAVLIYRDLTVTQGTHWPEGDPFPSASHENAADRLVMLAQQFKETISRVFRVAITSLLTEIEIPEGAGKLWGWNAAGDGATLYNQIIDTGVITTKGDSIRGGNGGIPERLPIGTAGQIKKVVSGQIEWASGKLDDMETPDDNTDLDVSITKHGLTPKLPNDKGKFFSGAGNYLYPALKGYFSNLKIAPSSYGVKRDHQLAITADSVVMEESGGTYYEAKVVSVMLDLSTGGANGLDTGVITRDTWYYIWLIYNNTTVASLASLSSDAPTMPSGYTYRKLLGVFKNVGPASHLHMDGADEGVTFTDESGKTWTVGGDANTEQSTKKFGTASAEFDGTGDYITTVDHPDFDFMHRDFTIEFWVKRNRIGVLEYLSGQVNAAGDTSSVSYHIRIDASNNLEFSLGNGTALTTISIASFTDTTNFHHLALVRKGQQFKGFLDGVGTAPTAFTGSVYASTANISLGRGGMYPTSPFQGFIDESYIVVGVAKYWDNFTPADSAYANNISILPFIQINREVQLNFPIKVADDVGSTSTSSVSLTTAVPAIAKGVWGKWINNKAGANGLWISPRTFPNILPGDNSLVHYMTSLSAQNHVAQWIIHILEEITIYIQLTDGASADIWVSGYDLKGI